MTAGCNVCGKAFGEPIYESPDELSITTMNKLVAGKTCVYFCSACGHLQTNELPDLKEYYSHEYEINLASEEDDQIYAVIDGKPVFRAEHQATVLQSKVDFFPGCRVLDYGCAKAPTIKKILTGHPDIEAFLFDVTDKYVAYWNRFPKALSWSVHQPDPAWLGTLDVVLSFYALEHVADLHAALVTIKSLLKPGGLFYFIVPNVYANIADFIVADHINHFSPSSLHSLLRHEGFTDISVDDSAHNAAFVVTTRLGSGSCARQEQHFPDLEDEKSAALVMAQYWRNIRRHIREFEAGLKPDDVPAIYGAGFYGNFVASTLANFGRVSCFVDQNPHLQGTKVHGRMVAAPEQLPPEVTHILVGLNPRTARTSIESIACWREGRLNYFFL